MEPKLLTARAPLTTCQALYFMDEPWELCLHVGERMHLWNGSAGVAHFVRMSDGRWDFRGMSYMDADEPHDSHHATRCADMWEAEHIRHDRAHVTYMLKGRLQSFKCAGPCVFSALQAIVDAHGAPTWARVRLGAYEWGMSWQA